MGGQAHYPVKAGWEEFVERLKKSSIGVLAAAGWFHLAGKTVIIPPTKIAPHPSMAKYYLDAGDLYILDNGPQLVQVKHLSAQWHDVSGWPFNNHVLVDGHKSIERLDAYMHLSLSADLNYGVIIRHDSKKHWYLADRLNHNTGNVEKFWACPKQETEFVTLWES